LHHLACLTQLYEFGFCFALQQLPKISTLQLSARANAASIGQNPDPNLGKLPSAYYALTRSITEPKHSRLNNPHLIFKTQCSPLVDPRTTNNLEKMHTNAAQSSLIGTCIETDETWRPSMAQRTTRSAHNNLFRSGSFNMQFTRATPTRFATGAVQNHSCTSRQLSCLRTCTDQENAPVPNK